MAESRLDTLQAGRALAAFAVVLFHLDISIWGMPQYFPHELFPPFRMGHVGVEFFFVLSGFLMTWLYGSRIGETGLGMRFLWKRALRVYPPYLVVLLPLVPVYFLFPSMGTGRETDPAYVVSSILLLPTPELPILGVAWTLQFEMLFYLAFTGVIAFPRLFKLLAVVWGLVAVARLFLPNPPFPLSFFTSPWILLFLFGVAAALLTKRGIARPFIWIAVGAVLFAAAAVAYEFSDISRNLLRNSLGIGSMLIIAGLVTAEAAGRIKVPRWVVYLGDASYSLYLVHAVVLSIAVKVLFAVKLDHLPEPIIAIALILACFAAAILLHEIVERRVMKIGRRKPNLGAASAA